MMQVHDRNDDEDRCQGGEKGGIPIGLGPFTNSRLDWQRLSIWRHLRGFVLRDGTRDLLKPSTLREMQRVQFMDTDWKTSWGLGFAIEHRDDHTYVGHAGDCPGYQTVLSMRNDDQTAVIVMDNSSEKTGPFAKAIFGILDKRKGYRFQGSLPAAGVRLEDYAGRYSEQPWNSESVMLPWVGGLALLVLPSA